MVPYLLFDTVGIKHQSLTKAVDFLAVPVDFSTPYPAVLTIMYPRQVEQRFVRKNKVCNK
jgi:hypothetical protein